MESGFASAPTSRTDSPAGAPGSAPPRTKICVYCGSSAGVNPEHMEAARELGRLMAANGIQLVYGGGTVGLMGEVAKTIVAASGNDPTMAHGIIPEALIKYERDDSTYVPGTAAVNAQQGKANYHVPDEAIYGRTTVVPDMHTRKQLFAKEVMSGGPGSGFIALSGGYGTMEELLETVTWNQIGIHSMGVCVLNVKGFYDGLLDFIGKSVAEGFIRGGNKDILAVANTAEEAIERLRDYKVAEQRYRLDWGTQ